MRSFDIRLTGRTRSPSTRGWKRTVVCPRMSAFFLTSVST